RPHRRRSWWRPDRGNGPLLRLHRGTGEQLRRGAGGGGGIDGVLKVATEDTEGTETAKDKGGQSHDSDPFPWFCFCCFSAFGVFSGKFCFLLAFAYSCGW